MSKDTKGIRRLAKTVAVNAVCEPSRPASTRSPNTRRKASCPRIRARLNAISAPSSAPITTCTVPQRCPYAAPAASAIGALGIGLATTATAISVTITTGPQMPARATNTARRSPSISPRASVSKEGANCHMPSKATTRTASPARMAARRPTSDRLYGLRQKVANLARYGRQVRIFDSLHRRHRVDGADLHTAIHFA